MTTTRMAWAVRRAEAHASRCTRCGAEPTVIAGPDGPLLQCPLHPDAVVAGGVAMTTETEAEPSKADLRALVAGGSRQLQQVADDLQGQSLREITLAKGFAGLLQRSGPQWLDGASEMQVMVFCRAAVYLRLNPLIGECYLLHGGFYVSVAGHRKLATLTGDMEGEGEPRMLTPEQEQVYGVRPGDIARTVDVWRRGWRAPAIGIGIVRAGELAAATSGRKGPDGLPFTPLGRNPEYMSAKRAVKDALRKAFPDIDLNVAEMDEQGRVVVDVEGWQPAAVPAPARQLPRGDTVGEGGPFSAAEPVSAAEPNTHMGEALASTVADATATVRLGTLTPRMADPPGWAISLNVLTIAGTAWAGEDAAEVDAAELVRATLGCTAEEWMSTGATADDAAAIATAVVQLWEAGGIDWAAAVSKAHALTALAGRPFTARVITYVDMPPMGAIPPRGKAAAATNEAAPPATAPARKAAPKAAKGNALVACPTCGLPSSEFVEGDCPECQPVAAPAEPQHEQATTERMV